VTGSFSKNDQIEVTCNDIGYTCPTCGKKFKKVRIFPGVLFIILVANSV